MTKQIRVEGVIHNFPDDATDEEINEALSLPAQNTSQPNDAMKQHPLIARLARSLQNHPYLKKGVEVAGEGAGFINKGVTASGLPNAARGLFQGGSDLFRGLASLTPTGAGLPSVNIPDPKFSEMPIEEVPIGGLGYNPLQKVGEAAGYAASLLNPQRAAVKGAEIVASKIPTSKNLASKILQDKSAIKNTYKGLYKDLFKSAEEQGIKEIEKPKGKINSIVENTPATYHKSLQKFINEPTLENAHWAQSDLGKLERSLEKAHENNPLTKPKLDALKQAKDYKEKLKQAMFNKSEGQLEKEYNKISEGYKTDVLPYTTNKSITKFGKDELLAKNLISNLKKNDKFMIALGEKYPGIKVNQLANSPAGKKIIAGLLYGTGAGAGLEAAHKLF